MFSANFFRFRIFIIILAFFSLFIGLIIGVTRIGIWSLFSYLQPHHSAILVGSFFGTLITLERVITIKRIWTIFLPILNGSSILLFLLNMPHIAQISLILGGFVLTAIYLSFFIQRKSLINFMFVVSGIIYIWSFWFYTTSLIESMYAWVLFFLFTIIAERLELTEYLNVPDFFKRLIAGSLITLVVILLAKNYIQFKLIFGLISLVTSTLMMRYDIAVKNILSKEPHRFRGWAILVGYIWLIVFALSHLFDLPNVDILIHSFFLGFVMNMVFAHAGIILPVVLRKSVEMNPKYTYSIWITFQIILLMRFFTFLLNYSLFKFFIIVNFFIILAFFLQQILVMKNRAD